MVSLFLLLGCNLSYIVDLFAALHELASASTPTLLIELASSVRALLKPYGDTLNPMAEVLRKSLKYFRDSKSNIQNFLILICIFPLSHNGISKHWH